MLVDDFLSHVPFLCKLYWILCGGAVVVTVLPLPVPEAFRRAVQLSAARGKLWSGRPRALGPLEDLSVPQRWFSHFYVLGMVANAVLLLMVACTAAATGVNSQQALSICAMCLFELHLLRRTIETLMIMVYPDDAKMHVIAYAYGISYYLAVPVSLLPESFFLEASWKSVPSNVYLAVSGLMRAWSEAASQQFWLCTLLGVITFALGSLLQGWTHLALAQLQRLSQADKKHDIPKIGYKIPRGGFFELVSCPHYLGEITIYAGLLLLTRGQLVVWLINVWVVFNLVLAAEATHRWYLKQFKNYPKSRHALLPFVY